MNCLSKRPNQGIGHVIQQRGVWIEVLQCDRFQFLPFSSEIVLQESYNLAISRVRGDVAEIIQDFSRRLACWFVDESLVVRIEMSDVHGLKELGKTFGMGKLK